MKRNENRFFFLQKDFLKLQFLRAAAYEILFTNSQLPYQGILQAEVWLGGMNSDGKHSEVHTKVRSIMNRWVMKRLTGL